MEPFSFASSEALDLPVSIRIVSLEGDETPFLDSTIITHPEIRHVGSNTSFSSDLYATAQVWAGSKPLTVPIQTAYRPFKSERKWNEWLRLPIRYSGLPANATVAVTVWDISPAGSGSGTAASPGHAVPFGGTTIPLFDKDNQLHKGRYKCLVHRLAEADGYDNSTTPAFPDKLSVRRRRRTRKVRKRDSGGGSDDGTVHDNDEDDDDADRIDSEDDGVDGTGDDASPLRDPDEVEIERMDRLFKKHEMGEIPRVEWLDQLVFRGFEKRVMRSAASSLKVKQAYTGAAARGASGDDPSSQANGRTANRRPGPSRFLLNVEFPRFDFPVVFVDHEYPPPPISSLQNLSASQSGIVLKPPPEVHLGPGIDGAVGDSALGGRLVRVYDPEVGARDNPAESKHRRLVRSQHRHGTLDKDLKPNAKVRDELNVITSYPPTQALSSEEKDLVWKFRYHLTREKKAVTKFVKSVNWQDAAEAKQAVQVLGRWTNIDVDDALELLGPTFDHRAVRAYAVERLRKSGDSELLLYLLQLVQALKFEHISTTEAEADAAAAAAGRDNGDNTVIATGHTRREAEFAAAAATIIHDSSLARFLITRAAGNLMLGNYFYWYLMVECDDHSVEQSAEYRAVYRKVAYDFMAELELRPGGSETRKTLRRQAEWVAVMAKIAGEVKEAHESIARRVERVRHYVQDLKNELVTIDPPLPLPLDPAIEVTSVSADDVAVFKSSLHPIKVSFRDTQGRKYPILFKMGDDLRQDQLVIQIITLMDQLLQKENLDLKLTPYKILATSNRMGLTQFVPSVSFQSLAARYKGAPNAALAYLRQNNPDAHAPLGLRRETLDTFVKSCAGYCVVTYILGVGDRHLDNLLLAPDGHFFHADFGFILGRDPKPFAPAMKLSKEMVEAMGGSGSEHYRQFKQYCFLAYTALRKSSNLILNLFSLMVDANIPDILWEPDKTVLKVQERFHLELNEEDAIRHFERVIDDNLNAIVPVVIDRLHEFVQAFRA
ncbi:phosphatidylinositol 3-kinase [Sporothrix brasiliensis 5110]|uniref:Phosphatidylinositol 3-kinase VPS34 n=1 Tax=Sporothrix brasiliensis 5110 TaxID=1398154 RepID=A0A0C2IRQ9_9PEZI|nr:phosphatidylinositol 3-kinase [Sporothrix brasiliensis 5110]KIH87667.1 phosphatidylinositol 3-kinase [Sporothrix brasiliensis 5110]